MVFDLNGRAIQSVPIDFNAVCDLEDLGVSLEDYQNKQMSFVRGYIALCMGGVKAKQIAGEEIQKHLIAGGNFDEVIKVIGNELDNSDFFRALSETQKENTTTSKSKKA